MAHTLPLTEFTHLEASDSETAQPRDGNGLGHGHLGACRKARGIRSSKYTRIELRPSEKQIFIMLKHASDIRVLFVMSLSVIRFYLTNRFYGSVRS